MNKNYSPTFGQVLRNFRGNRSQAEFAQMLGIDNQPTYCRYEQGRLPKPIVLKSIASRLGVTVDRLIGKVDDFQRQPESRLNFSPIGDKTNENLISGGRSTEVVLGVLRTCVRHLESVPLVNAGDILFEIEECVNELRRRIATQKNIDVDLHNSADLK